MIVAGLYLLLLAVVADGLWHRWPPLASFGSAPGYLLALGGTLFLAAWTNFALYLALGWGPAQLLASWGMPLAAVAWDRSGARARTIPDRWSRWRMPAGEWAGFLGLTIAVGSRFWFGLVRDGQGAVWCNFNFVDTAFHLSVANAFLEAPRFPPVDLDMAPLPLKYHFLADFFLAHVCRLGMPDLAAIWFLNLVSGLVLCGSLWAVFRRWLRLPPAWVFLAAILFLFLNTALVNLAHFVVLNPSFFRVQDPVGGILLFPYFNFESLSFSLFEPQRGLLFSFPIILLILDIAFGGCRLEPPAPGELAKETRVPAALVGAFWLVCLLPLGNVVGFSVMAVMLLPALWRERRAFMSCWPWWFPLFLVGLAQLWYIRFYGPPVHPDFADWDAASEMPLEDFQRFPAWSRRGLFWFFANGDFLGWGGLFAIMALTAGLRGGAVPAGLRALRGFIRQWAWYLGIAIGFFLLINYYRYTFFWGDSNKFVLYLNLGLALIVTLGAACWREGEGRVLSRGLWLFFFALCMGRLAYVFHHEVIAMAPGKILLFTDREQEAARWLREHRAKDEAVLTAAFNTFHFVTPLAGVATRAGIYGDFNPHRPAGLRNAVKNVYEQDDFSALEQLGVRYVCLSRGERRRYTIHENWLRRTAAGEGVVFASGAAEDEMSVFLIDWRRLAPPSPKRS